MPRSFDGFPERPDSELDGNQHLTHDLAVWQDAQPVEETPPQTVSTQTGHHLPINGLRGLDHAITNEDGRIQWWDC